MKPWAIFITRSQKLKIASKREKEGQALYLFNKNKGDFIIQENLILSFDFSETSTGVSRSTR
jgi:hypothetical protein